MKKVILVDGNNLLFRSYYATIYSGAMLKNSKGFPTNALYGFVSMINKIIMEETPEYMVVAFDIGKNFRKEKYDFYKEGRNETPDDLKVQMPKARELLDAMGIKYLEMAPYEADDIIGTVAKYAESDPEYETLIVSSDKDLLQLISQETEIKLLKQTGFIRYNLDSFKNEWGIDPINIIDLKAIMGDASDNIPGVKGIGEKGALKLLQEYKTLDNIYNNIDNIKGKIQEKLIEDKDSAYMSYEIATIYRDVPIEIDFESFKYNGPKVKELQNLYNDLEFYSFLKSINENLNEKIIYTEVSNVNEINKEKDMAFYLEVDNENYHKGNIIGLGLCGKNNNYYIKRELINDVFDFLKDINLITYDLKKTLVKVSKDIKCSFDLMIGSYLLNKESTFDISVLSSNVPSFGELKRGKFDNIDEIIVKKTKFIIDNYEDYLKDIHDKEMDYILNEIEMPLIYVLTDMELNGFKFENNRLDKMKQDIKNKLSSLEKEIYDIAGEEFNIFSTRTLGTILFEKLEIGKGKKNKIGYKTDVKTLENYSYIPIVSDILEYRNLNKLLTTYIEGLNDYVFEDGKIHSIFNQTLTRTGRLSSSEPNLQNIPVKDENGKKIRMAFVPENDYIVSADYSQIELRVLAHISECKELIEAFINGADIHTKVSADINGKKESEVTKQERSMAKAVIFGIVYGISGFGLGENLHISNREATEFINKYYELYPGVKRYMDNIKDEAYKTGEVKTIFGRIRRIDELSSSNFMVKRQGERMAFNTPIQGTSADIMKLAMIKVYNELKKNNLQSKMVLQVHDEIIIDTKKEELDIIKKILTNVMENIVSLSVPLKIEINSGINWYDAK